MHIPENPVAGRELGALLRSRRLFLAEFAFLGFLSLAVWWGWPQEMVKVADRAQRSERLFQLFASVQTLLVALIAPVFSAGAFTAEKESLCFEFLYVTPLMRRSIVFGKLASSVVILLIVVLSSAPLASMCLVMGGVSGGQVVGLYLVLLSAGILFGVIGVHFSIRFERTYAALGTCYLVVLPVVLFLAVIVHSYVQGLLPVGITFALLTLIIAAAGCGGMIRRLDRPPETGGPSFRQPAEGVIRDYGVPLRAVIQRDKFPDRFLFPGARKDAIPDGVNPVLDRELRAESFGYGLLLVRWLIQVSIVLSLFFLVFVLAGEAKYFGFFLVSFLMVVGPSLGSGAVSLERERKTLDLLVTTGVRAWTIIAGKVYVSARLAAVLTLILMPPLLIGLIPPVRVTIATVVCMVAEVVCVAVFVNTVGVACSVVARRTVQSMVATYGIVFLLFAGVHILEAFLRVFSESPEPGLRWLTLLSPFAAVARVTEVLRPGAVIAPGQRWAELLAWGSHAALLLTISALLLVALRGRFEALVRDR